MKFVDNMKNKIEIVFKEQLPKIKELITMKVGPAARGAAENKEICAFVSGKIYKFLPLPIRLTISESQFSEFLWNNRHIIFPEERDEIKEEIADKSLIGIEMNKNDIIQEIYLALEEQRNAIDVIHNKVKILKNILSNDGNQQNIWHIGEQLGPTHDGKQC